MRKPEPCTLETPQVRLEPLETGHAADIEAFIAEHLTGLYDALA